MRRSLSDLIQYYINDLCVCSFILNNLYWSGFRFLKIFIYLWLCWVFVTVHELTLVAVRQLLIAVASLATEHGYY